MILLVIILTPTPTTWIWIISHLEVLDHSGPRTPIKGYMQAHPQMARLLPKPITLDLTNKSPTRHKHNHTTTPINKTATTATTPSPSTHDHLFPQIPHTITTDDKYPIVIFFLLPPTMYNVRFPTQRHPRHIYNHIAIHTTVLQLPTLTETYKISTWPNQTIILPKI